MMSIDQIYNLPLEKPVISIVNFPPVGPYPTKTRYLVGNSPTGSFAGHAKEIAEWNGLQWKFKMPLTGTFVYVNLLDDYKKWDGVNWTNFVNPVVNFAGGIDRANYIIPNGGAADIAFLGDNGVYHIMQRENPTVRAIASWDGANELRVEYIDGLQVSEIDTPGFLGIFLGPQLIVKNNGFSLTDIEVTVFRFY